MRRIVLASAVVLGAGVLASTASAKPSSPSEPTSCASDVSLTISQTVLWPPNHKMIPVTITASDTDGDGDSANVMIGTITNSDETNGSELNGSGKPDASAMTDQQGSGQSASLTDPGSASLTVQLAAERSGHDIVHQNGTSGRTYTIPVTCSESGAEMLSGNTVNMTVFVPHDQGNNVG